MFDYLVGPGIEHYQEPDNATKVSDILLEEAGCVEICAIDDWLWVKVDCRRYGYHSSFPSISSKRVDGCQTL